MPVGTPLFSSSCFKRRSAGSLDCRSLNELEGVFKPSLLVAEDTGSVFDLFRLEEDAVAAIEAFDDL